MARFKKLVPFFLFLFLHGSVFSQKQGNIWYFGDHAGLDFNSGSPVFIPGQTYAVGCPGCHNEGSSVICDSTGALLFYSNGEKIWNKIQQVMPNGDSLEGGVSSTQAALIVPQPGSSRFYYLFTTDDFTFHNLQGGIRYSVIDMCLDNGKGDVITGRKNILLLDTVAEKLTAVKHSNGVDYWIIVHKYFSDAFYAYRLTSSGIADTVISHTGSFHPTGNQSIGAAIGQMKASPNGLRLAVVNGNSTNSIAEYFDFDKSTGVVSNCVNIVWNPIYYYYGVSFSPDNSKLYVASILNGNGIYQFDLGAGNGDPDSVRASRTLVTANYNYNFQALQLAADGKIYVTHAALGNPYLSVIANPNAAGLNCNYLNNAVSLNGYAAYYGLPNFIDSYDYDNAAPDCPSGVVEFAGHAISVHPDPFSTETTIQWPGYMISGTLELYDHLGRLVLQMNISGENITLSRGELESGIYLVKITSEKGITLHQKLVITHD